MAAIFDSRYLDVVPALSEIELAERMAAGRRAWDAAAAAARVIDDDWINELVRDL